LEGSWQFSEVFGWRAFDQRSTVSTVLVAVLFVMQF
jgi:hypothetical protein